jgi:TP901 family phage tail tape measure protein
MSNRIIDATLRFVDKFTAPMDSAIGKIQRQSSEMMKAGRQISRFGNNIENAGKKYTATITTPIVGAGIAAVSTAANFEKGMSKVQSISGATGDDMDALTKKAQEMGAKTKFSASESADAFSYMAMAGWNAGQMMDGIEGVMYLAGATGEDLATTSDIVTDALTAFGMKAKDTNKFVDILAQTANKSNTNVSMLGESFKYVAPSAGSLGYSAADTATALGLMANNGIKASQAGTSLNSWFTRMAKPTKESSKAMEDLGISMTDANGKMKPLRQVMSETRGAFNGLTKSQKAQYAAMLAGKTGMSGLLAIVNSSDKDFNKLSKSIDNSKGAAKKMYNVANNNLLGSLTTLKSTVESIAINFGNKLTPTVKKITGYLQEAANKFNNLSDSQQNTIIKVAGIVATVGPAMIVIGGLTSKVSGAIRTVGRFGKALSSAGGLMGLITSPVGIAIITIGALVTAGILLYKNWDKVSAAAKKLGNWINSIFKRCGLDIGSFAKTAKSKLTEFGSKVKQLWTIVRPVVSKIRDIFGTVFKLKLAAIMGAAVGLFSSFVNSIGNVASGVMTALGGIVDFITGVFTGNWKKAWNGVKDIFGGIFKSLVSLAKMPLNGVIGLINGAIEGVNKIGIEIPDWVPKLGGKKFKIDIPQIPMLYKGTSNWMGGPAMIHDKGAEIVDLPQGTRVYPHDKSLQMARESGSKNVKVVVEKICEQIVVRNDSDIDKIADALARKLEAAAVNMA